MVYTRKKKTQQKRKFCQLNGILIDFIIGNNANMDVTENEILEKQAKGHHRDFEGFVDKAGQNQVIGNNAGYRIRDAVVSAVVAIEYCMHDPRLTLMNDVVIRQIAMTVRSVTGSSGNGPNSIVQNPDWRDYTGNVENTPLKSTSSRLDLNVDQI